MHALEHMLLILAARIRSGEEAPHALAEDARALASLSHFYIVDPDLPFPERDNEGHEMNEQWLQRWGRLMR